MQPHTDPAATSGEFADYDGEVIPFRLQIVWSRLYAPETLRALAAVTAGVLLLSAGSSGRVLAIVLGVMAAAWLFTDVAFPSESGRRWDRLALAAAFGGLAIALATWPSITGRVVARLLGSGTILLGARDLVQALRGPVQGVKRSWLVVRGLGGVLLGAALWAAPLVLMEVALSLLGLFWIVSGVVTAATNLSSDRGVSELTAIWPRLFEWLENRPHSADDRSQLYEKLFYEGRFAKRRLSRFFLLMGFATVIAAFGVIGDSTAVVIGAMLVAPLMTPLMGTSLSLVMGWPRRAAMSAVVAGMGILLAIGISLLFAAGTEIFVSPEANSQVAARVAPTLVDLVVAVAAGAAGAFALSRPDVSDALPGVAIAISLVPPLAVVGIMLQAGLFEEALGALLLFATNLLAILLVGSVVFLLTGVVPVRILAARREWVRSVTTLVAILTVLVVAVLGTASDQLLAQAFDQREVERAVATWIGDRSLEIRQLDVGSAEVEVRLSGGDQPGPPEDLATLLRSELGRDVRVVVRWVPEERYVVERAGPG
jgi:uncharacterized hydrophobic protein (TIGR00271 family)